VYQGDALFSFSLVDPDNRRPVEFSRRRRLLGSLQARFERTPAARATLLRELVARPEDGRIKLHVMRTALATRRRIDAPFATGAHLPLAARGPAAAHVLAFARRAGDAWAVAVAPRLPRTLVGDGRRAPVGAAVWGETALCLPRPLAGRRLASALCGVRLEVPDAASPTLPLARVLEELPVALLVARGRPGHR
jgi:(1->4)-alpha-D-glucan 1-alpha-D-glucosylmutase